MADIRLVWNQDQQRCDWTVVDGQLAADSQLESVVLLQLFTDSLVQPDYVLTDGSNDRRGWWADGFEDPNYPIGSWLSELERRKITNHLALAAEAKVMLDRALQRLVDWGLATSVTCSAYCPPAGPKNSGTWLRLDILVVQAASPPQSFSYPYRLT